MKYFPKLSCLQDRPLFDVSIFWQIFLFIFYQLQTAIPNWNSLALKMSMEAKTWLAERNCFLITFLHYFKPKPANRIIEMLKQPPNDLRLLITKRTCIEGIHRLLILLTTLLLISKQNQRLDNLKQWHLLALANTSFKKVINSF